MIWLILTLCPSPPTFSLSLSLSLQTLVQQTRHQAALHLACSFAAEDSYLMALKIFSDWLTEHPLVVTVSTQVGAKSLVVGSFVRLPFSYLSSTKQTHTHTLQDSPGLWSRLASLLNLLPPAQETIAAGLRTSPLTSPPLSRQCVCIPTFRFLFSGTAAPAGMEWSQTNALHEDVLLRGFTPLTDTHHKLQFGATGSSDTLEQVSHSAFHWYKKHCVFSHIRLATEFVSFKSLASTFQEQRYVRTCRHVRFNHEPL